MVDCILGKAKNEKRLDGLTFRLENSYVVIVNRKCHQPFARLLLHEFVHIIVDIHKPNDYNTEHLFIETLVERYVDEIEEENYAGL